jgi:hypothetical protein
LGVNNEGDCLIRFGIERYEDIDAYNYSNSSYVENFNLDMKNMTCPYTINEEILNSLSCPLGMCTYEGVPGSSIFGLFLDLQMTLSIDVEEESGCYGSIVEDTVNLTVTM